jgi:CRISPR-associated protein Cas5t
MGCFYLQAKFAVFRPFTSGSFRTTSGFITPSAGYGLLLNIAGIEMRHDDGKSPMTLIKKELPRIRLALGSFNLPGRHGMFQQLHNYPIGTTGKEHAANTKGNKYNIIPVRREFLSEIRAYICTEDNAELDSKISEGLSGKTKRKYGLPFLGDNNFLLDRFEPVIQREPVWWFEVVEEGQDGLREHTTRLTTTIDRADLSRTRSFLFAPTESKQVDPPSKSWVVMP